MSDDAFASPITSPPNLNAHHLPLELAGASVPAMLLVPHTAPPLPVALLLHGYSSSKERLSATVGHALATRGIASLALDLPLHGARDDAIIAQARSSPFALMTQWRAALAEARAAIDWITGDERLDPHRIATVGYSLGGYIALITAARDPRVRAVAIAAGGDLPDSPWTAMLRRLVDPLAAARQLEARPLLMLHGRRDRTIPPLLAQRLFDAASHPKQITWYDSGHVLPAAAAGHAADWLRTSFA